MAHSTKAPAQKQLGLPMLISSKVEIGRLLLELDMIDDALLQLQLRKKGAEIKMPKTSQLMERLVQQNELNLLQETDRKLLQQFLQAVKDTAPTIHMSFSADPSVDFMEKLMTWLRREIHPVALVTVGLQPNIGAGCVIRTVNKQFDFSLRQDFAKKREMLRQQIAPAEVAT